MPSNNPSAGSGGNMQQGPMNGTPTFRSPGQYLRQRPTYDGQQGNTFNPGQTFLGPQFGRQPGNSPGENQWFYGPQFGQQPVDGQPRRPMIPPMMNGNPAMADMLRQRLMGGMPMGNGAMRPPTGNSSFVDWMRTRGGS